MVLTMNNKTLLTTADGFLVNLNDWDEIVALEIAKVNKIELTPAHWEILQFIRGYYLQYGHLPNTRMFVKAVGKSLGPEKGNSQYLHRLLPDGPLKYACKLAGLPKPPNCL